MYSGVAEPASPASTCAASPGARCSSRKFSRRMANTTGTAWSSRRITYAGLPPAPLMARGDADPYLSRYARSNEA